MRTLIETVVMFKENVGTLIEFAASFIEHQVNMTTKISGSS